MHAQIDYVCTYSCHSGDCSSVQQKHIGWQQIHVPFEKSWQLLVKSSSDNSICGSYTSGSSMNSMISTKNGYSTYRLQ
jgi:hypothetical protein